MTLFMNIIQYFYLFGVTVYGIFSSIYKASPAWAILIVLLGAVSVVPVIRKRRH